MTPPSPLSLLKCPFVIVGFVALILGFTFWAGYAVGSRRDPPPVPVQIAHALTQQAESARARIDTVVQVKTQTLTKTLTDYQTIRDTVTLTERIHDTVWVKTVIARCDTLAQSCAEFKSLALAKFAVDSQVIHAKDRELSAWAAAQPSRGHRLLAAGKWFLVGALVGHALAPPRHASAALLSVRVPAPPLLH